MNRKNDVVQASDGLSLDHQGQLLNLIEQSSKQTQLLHNQMYNQNKYNRIILLIVFVAIAIIFFLSLKFFDELNKKNSSKTDLTMKDLHETYKKLAKDYGDELQKMEDSLNKKTAQMNAKNQKEKDILFKEMEKYYKDIILVMEKARKNSEQLSRNSEQLSQKYKKQITDYETRIFIQKKQIRDISTRIAEFENDHSLLLKNHKKLLLENKKLINLNRDLEKRLRPYLSPQEQIELERKKKKDN